MTIQETILGYPGLGGISPELLNTALIDRGLSPADDYNADVTTQVNLVKADLLVAVITSTDYTENKLSEKFPRKEMKEAAMRMYRENGEPEKANALARGKFKIVCRAPQKW